MFQVTGEFEAAFSEKLDTYLGIDHETSCDWLIVNINNFQSFAFVWLSLIDNYG